MSFFLLSLITASLAFNVEVNQQLFSDKETARLTLDLHSEHTLCSPLTVNQYASASQSALLAAAQTTRYSIQLKTKPFISLWGLLDETVGYPVVGGTGATSYRQVAATVDPATFTTTLDVPFPAATCDYVNEPECLDAYYFEVTAYRPIDEEVDNGPEHQYLYEHVKCDAASTDKFTVQPTLRVARVTNPATSTLGVHPRVKRGEYITFEWTQGADYDQCIELADGATDGVVAIYFEDGRRVHRQAVDLATGPFELTWPVDERFSMDGSYRIDVASASVPSCGAGFRAGEATPDIAFTVVPASAHDYNVECHLPLYRGIFGAGTTFNPRALEDRDALPAAHSATSCGVMWRYNRQGDTITYDVMLRHCGALLGDDSPVADIAYSLVDKDEAESTYTIVQEEGLQEAKYLLRDESPYFTVSRTIIDDGWRMYHRGLTLGMLVGPRDQPALAAVSLRLLPQVGAAQDEWHVVMPTEEYEAQASLANVHMDSDADLQLTDDAKAFASLEGGFIHPSLGHFTRSPGVGYDPTTAPFSFAIVEAPRSEPLYQEQCDALMDVGELRGIPQAIASTNLCASICAQRYGLSLDQPALRVGATEDDDETPVTLIVGIVAGVLVLCCCVLSVGALAVLVSRRRNASASKVPAMHHQHARTNSHRHTHRTGNSRRGSARFATPPTMA